ncbi:MAG: tetratricopeptide repeat protein [Dysgonomonas sp.]|nr:tetratricopeptide repeat protein [Dysgonomonas sp.]
MKLINIITVLLFCFSLTLNAQTKNDLAQARTYLKNKEYDKALPIFEQEYNAKPTDAAIALSYGICLVETGGNLKRAEEALLVASKKNQPESYLYLGDIYVKEYRVSEAEELYARYAKARPRDKTALPDRSEKLERMERLISRTEDIQVIDSVVVDKAGFLSAYKLSADAGTLVPFKEVFPDLKPIESVVYTNGMGSKIYFGQTMENRYVIATMDKLLTDFGNEKLMSDNNFGLEGDTNYPFVLTDGTTAYFAGKNEEGMGGYDIYVTRYNLNNDSYLTPELLNMPFNSTANDYMMVYDEIKGVGWFATDRFQPEGKVCVYTFIQNDEVVLVDTDDDQYREKRARLSSIKDTWKAGKDYAGLIAKAKQSSIKETARRVDFTFIVNDNNTYHQLSDFKNTTARNMYAELSRKRKELKQLEDDLDTKRDEYSKVSSGKKNTLTTQILSLEKKQNQLFDEVASLETLVRNEEIKSLK